MYKWLKGAVAGGVALGATVAAANAQVFDLVDVNDPQAENKVSALMEPILPFVASGASTTTSIVQLGDTNYALVLTDGQSNYGAIVQEGARNRVVQAIQGSNSAALLVDGGVGNSVLQASIGNDNFQAVALGKDSSNNEVGYVQVGNSLAGALNVGNSRNSTVVTLQTPASGNFLMPTGINGLQDKIVVIVPGRMYVFSK